MAKLVQFQVPEKVYIVFDFCGEYEILEYKVINFKANKDGVFSIDYQRGLFTAYNQDICTLPENMFLSRIAAEEYLKEKQSVI